MFGTRASRAHPRSLPARSSGARSFLAISPCGLRAVVAMMNTPWMTRERGYFGAAAMQRAILAECGSDRSIRPSRARRAATTWALRSGTFASTAEWWASASTGRWASAPRASRGMYLAEEVALNEILKREIEEKVGEIKLAAIRRERDRMRKRNSRLCKRHG